MNPEPTTTRRDFLTTSAIAGGLALSQAGLFAGENNLLKLGRIGCGGGGTGAAKNALKADSNVKLTAMGDVFEDRLQESLRTLQRNKEISGKVEVKPEMCFTGFDAYKKVI